jgi:hypothetical protein
MSGPEKAFPALAKCIGALDPNTNPVRTDAINLKQAREELRKAIELLAASDNFYAMVRGESPSLLEDDMNAFRFERAIAACLPSKGQTREKS